MTTTTKEKINQAIAFQREKKFLEAEKLYVEILSVEPNNAIVLNLIGLLKYQQGLLDEAVELIKKSIEINPCAYFYGNLGKIYIDKSNFLKAIDCQKKALEKEPDNFDNWFYLAIALRKNNQADEAVKAYKKAIMLNPNLYQVYFNLGNLYFDDKNDSDTAAIYYRKALWLNPNDDFIKYTLAEACIKSKQYEEGINLFETRISREAAILSCQKVIPEILDIKPIWNGEPVEDKTVYVYYEAAYGDTIMYARYLPLLKEKCKKVIFKSQTILSQLFKDADYGICILDSVSLEKDLEFDYHIPLMSIPYVMKLFEEKDIPFKEGFLKANTEKVIKYKEKYFNNDKFKIGIKWEGNTNLEIKRKINFEAFFKLFGLKNTQFYSIQKGSGEEELVKAKDYNIIDLASTFNDFSDTAAAIENMDLVICNDTSVGHLAGALGKPCRMLHPYVQNWRWTKDLSYCIWYNSLRHYKQNEPDNWEEVFDRLYLDLKGAIG